MFTLPDVPGQYPVGATTFAVSVDTTDPQARIIGEARLKASSGGRPNEPALNLEEVAFTAYYPADLGSGPGGAKRTKSRKGIRWIARPVSGVLRGYAHFCNWNYWMVSVFLGLIARLLRIPVYANAPLLDPYQRSHENKKPWPVVLFSHGLGGTRTNYSHFCTRLASTGRIVLAFEHRDGSGPFVQTHSAIPGSKQHGKPNTKLYLHPEDVLWEEDDEKTKFALREDQLKFRHLEIYIGFVGLQKLVQSTVERDADELPCIGLHTIGGPWSYQLRKRTGDQRFWSSWCKTDDRVKVQFDKNVCFAGHSFGGATVLSLLSQEPPSLGEHKFDHIPIASAIALDPWVEPLPSPGPPPLAVASSLDERVQSPPRLLVINSEGFTLWDGHFQHLEETMKIWNKGVNTSNPALATLVTIVRCQHVQFSDYGVLLPFGQITRNGRKVLYITCDLSTSFLDDRLGETLARLDRVTGEVQEVEVKGKNGKAKWKKRFVGNVGDIIIH